MTVTQSLGVPFVGHVYALHKNMLKDEKQKEKKRMNLRVCSILPYAKKEESNLSEITTRALPESCCSAPIPSVPIQVLKAAAEVH